MSITSISYDVSIVTLDITSVKQNDFLRMMDLVRKKITKSPLNSESSILAE